MPRGNSTDISSLSADTLRLVDRLFPVEDRETARELLAQQCGANLPFLEGADALELERYRFAALKLSNGTTDGLSRAVALAKADWRDLLMAAGFGHDVNAHRTWLRTLVHE